MAEMMVCYTNASS